MSFFRPFLRSLSGGGGNYGSALKLATFAAVGDSITDRSTVLEGYGYQNAICYDYRGWAAVLEQLTNRRLVGVGPTPNHPWKTGAKKDRDHAIGGLTANGFLNGFMSDDVFYAAPCQDAIYANPDFYIVHIGTNDIYEVDAATVAARVVAVWDYLVATGKPVIGTDILQRASFHNSEVYRDIIIDVNTILRASWQAAGLLTYRRWDDLILKDELTGFAADSEYPDNAKTGLEDGIHPGAGVALKLARDLKGFLDDYINGTAPTIPVDGSSSWVTPNPYVAGGTTLATGWAAQFLGTIGTDTIFSKVTDSDGTWQRVQVVNSQVGILTIGGAGVYARNTTLSQVQALIGKQIVATARIRIPADQFSGVGIAVQCVGATDTVDWTNNSRVHWQDVLSPIGEYEVTIYTDPFIVPVGTTQIWILVYPGQGTGYFDFQKSGIIKL